MCNSARWFWHHSFITSTTLLFMATTAGVLRLLPVSLIIRLKKVGCKSFVSVIGVFVLTFAVHANAASFHKKKPRVTRDKNVMTFEYEFDEDREHVYYYPRVLYDFKVNGEVFHGFKMRLLQASMSRKRANALIANYTPGERISIYYDPKEPTESVIQPGEQKYLYIFLVIGIGLIAVSIVKLFT